MRWHPIIAIFLAIIPNSTTWAGTVSGAFEGLADIEVQQFVLGQQVGPTVNYQAVPSRIDFTITVNTNPGNGPFAFTLTNSVFSLDSTNPDALYPNVRSSPEYVITYVTDGVPGQSADSAIGAMESAVYHLWGFQGYVQLTDPTGQYIGPNGDGDPSGVLVTANYVYQPWDFEDTGQTYTVSFTTDPPPADPPASVPEPSSFVMMLTGLLTILVWSLR